MAQANIEAVITGVQQAVGQLEQISASLARLEGKMQSGATATRKAAAATKQLSVEQTDAIRKAQALANKVGVSLPSSMQKVIARSAALQKVIGAAFAVTNVVSFGAAILSLVPQIRQTAEKLGGLTEQVRALEEAAKDANDALLKLPETAGLAALGAAANSARIQLANAEAQLESVRQAQLGNIPGITAAARGLRNVATDVGAWFGLPIRPFGALQEQAEKDVARLSERYQKLQTDVLNAWKAFREGKEATNQAAEDLKVVDKAWNDYVHTLSEALREQEEARQAVVALSQQEIPLVGGILAKDPLSPIDSGALSENITTKRQQALQQILDMEFENSQQILHIQGRTVDAIVRETERRVRETERQLRLLGINETDIARATEAIWAEANLEIAQEQQQQFEQMAQQIESFFQQVFLTARSFSDVWKQLLQQLLRLFVSFVAKMIAAWLSGMQTMRRGAGGILGSIFGALFGGGGFNLFGAVGAGSAAAQAATGGASAAAAGSPAQIAAAGNLQSAIEAGAAANVAAISGIAPSAGQGITTAGVGSVSRVAKTGGASASFLSRFGTADIAGLLSTGALSLGGLLLGRGGPVSGAFGGALLGAGGIIGANLIGAAVTGTSLGTIGSFLGAAFSGPFAPIVIGIGALLGGLFGAFSRGKKKRQATKIANEGFAAMTEVIKQFRAFEVDFESALASLNAIWDQMVAGWQQIGGKVGKRSIRSQRPFFEEKVRELQMIQDAREARASLEVFGLIPEFAVGGFVSDAVRSITSSQGKILAFLHQGEAVLNARAVQALGRSFIESANRAPGFQTGGFASPTSPSAPVTINIQPGAIVINPSPGMDERALARFARQELERTLRDQGLTLGR